ncbi:MAG: HAD family hydrolase [Oscillospiraceae bacterium]
MKIKAVLFDLDGTLINTLADLCDSANYSLKKMGYPPQPLNNFKMYVGDGIPKMLERAMPKPMACHSNIEKAKAFFMEYYSVHNSDKTAHYDGMPQLIAELRKKGFKTAVVTNKDEKMAKVILDKLYGENTFDLIFGAREGVPTKPDPTLALMAMKELKVLAQECVFIGDSGVDIKTAVNSGAFPVGVLWGFRGRDELVSSGAKQLINHPSELISIIDTLE